MNGNRGSLFGNERGVTLAELAVTLALFGMIMVGVMMTWSKTQQAYFVGSEVAESQQNVRAAIDFMVRELRATGRDVTVCAFDYEGPTALDCTAAKVTTCRVTRNLQATGYTANGCQGIFAMPFAAVTANSIQIRSDRNSNGTIAGTANSSAADDPAENVVYARATASPPCPSGVSACITRNDGSGAVAMVAVDINTLAFTYYPRLGFPPCLDATIPCTTPFTLPLATQYQADNIGRIRLSITSQAMVGGDQINRQLETDIVLKNRLGN